ncbi:restriction endonuclease subunit S [Wandonia haliotis]|uniref:Restriction endonuclease subunit S n=1 Tax=Wandonia haliotis TaxID=574963 RepID=A0ABP3Y7E5_9FLAO
MKKYDSYKDSGIEWIHEIPNHWNESRLKYLFSFGKGLSITKENLVDKGIPCVNYGEIHSKCGFKVNPEIDTLKCVPEEYLNKSINALLTNGDFVFADTSEDIEGSGNFTHLDGNINVFAGYHTVVMKPSQIINSRFFAYQFDSLEFRSQIRSSVKGIKVLSITQSILKNCSIWIPSIPEQTAIANFLDHKTAQIDDLVRKKERLIELLKEERTAIINQAVTKGLHPNVPMKDSGIEWLGEIPEHWEVWKISHAFPNIGSGTTPESGNPVYHENGTINWLNTGNLNDGFLQSCSKKITEKAREDYSSLKIYPPGSLVIAMYGATIGKTAIVDFETTTNQACCVFCKGEIIDLKFLQYWFKAKKEHIISLSVGGGQPNISQQILKDIRLGAPSLDEQIQVVEYLEVKDNFFSMLENKLENEIELLKEYKTTLVSEVVTGKVDVRVEKLNG